jgi:hypothetical protein
LDFIEQVKNPKQKFIQATGHGHLKHKQGNLYRVAKGSYHAVFPISDYVIYHENKPGPFLGDNNSIYADWSPEKEDLDEIKTFKKNHKDILNMSKL